MRTATATAGETKGAKPARTLWSLYKEAQERDMTVEEAGKFVLDHASRAALLRLVQKDYRDFCRARVLGIEQQADAPVALLEHPGDSSPSVFEDRLAWLARMAKEPFHLPDGTPVLWGKATPAQHRERADSLENQVHSTLATVKRHRIVADMIEAAGVHNADEMLKTKGGRR